MIKKITLDENYSRAKLVKKEKPTLCPYTRDMEPNQDEFETVFFPSDGNKRVKTEGYFKKSYKNKPLISIITVVFNEEKRLEETILSVLNQTYDNVEYIIIDGGSSDGTMDIIKTHEDKIDYWVSEKDEGIYDAWNKGVKSSNGEWIGFVSAGDCYLPDALENYVACINQACTIDYISSKNILCNDDKKFLRTIGSAWKWDVFKRFMNVAHVGSLHNQKLFDTYGLYDTRFRICGDYELLLRAGSSLKTLFLNHITCMMRVGGISDGGLEVFKEAYKAKTIHKSRGVYQAKVDMLIAIIKWFIRQKIWY